MRRQYNEGALYKLRTDLADLDREWIEVKGRRMKPSQCYRLGTDPVHILYNSNCPEVLKKRIETLLKKYLS